MRGVVPSQIVKIDESCLMLSVDLCREVSEIYYVNESPVVCFISSINSHKR